MKKTSQQMEVHTDANATFGRQLQEQGPTTIENLKPNYAHIRKLFMLIASVACIVILIMQLALYAVFKMPNSKLEFKTSEIVHLLKYLIIPSSVNFTVVIVAWILNRRKLKNEMVQNIIPLIAIATLCGTSASAHSVYSITFMLPCIPVFVASIYGIKKLMYATSATSALGMVSAFFCRLASPYYHDRPDTKLVPEFIIALGMLGVSTAIGYMLIQLFNVQKNKLVSTVQDAQASRMQAQAANQAKTEFLANMSHEIRTPLNAVVGLTEMIVRKAEQDEIKEYAADIQQASNSLLAIINDILDISKIESGKMEIMESNYELGSLINDSYNMVAARWKEKGLTAIVTCDPTLPRMLRGDEYHLRQVVVNLLTNAIKYTNDGGIEMRVSGEENGDVLRLDIMVKDTGIGIKEEDLPKLFDKFSRLEMGRNRHVEGSGLGLSITKQLVELMNGSITVESVYGVGTTFTVRVPQKIVDRTPIGDVHATYLNMHGAVEEYKQSFEAPTANILVVDDIVINLTVIRKLLEGTKINVDVAESGRECLMKVCEKKYDVILMDHMMPKMDGVQTLEAMKKLENNKNADTPVIMLTANAMVGVRDKYIAAGFADYLAKPVRGSKLELMLLRHLPASKVTRTGEVAEEQSTAAVDEKQELSYEALGALLPELDRDTGMTYCANDEGFYMSMLQEFAASDRDVKLCKAFDERDWETYQIEVHTLKSSAKMVGLIALSNDAFELEMAARRHDVDFISQHHDALIEHYRKVVKILKG